MARTHPPKALAFDVFGTVVDWRTSLARQAGPILAAAGRADLDPDHFADAWRQRYMPLLTRAAKSPGSYRKLDVLHREMLDDLLAVDGIELSEAARTSLILAWHRLDPWPDSVEGLMRLRRRFPIVACSNGNIAFMVDVARHAGLPWDAILGAEFAQAYKPDAAVYRRTAEALDLEPHDLCLVAAHHSDLAGARRAGLQCAFIARPMEYGGAPAPDLAYEQAWEFRADSLTALADIFVPA